MDCFSKKSIHSDGVCGREFVADTTFGVQKRESARVAATREKRFINQEDYGNSDQNFVTDSLPLVKDSAQKPDPNVIKIMIDPGHANYYNPSTVVNGYYESVMTWTLSNYLKEELEALGVQKRESARVAATREKRFIKSSFRWAWIYFLFVFFMKLKIIMLHLHLSRGISLVYQIFVGQILMTQAEQLDSF